MTDLNRDDIRAAVGAGMISEAQAASLVARAQARSGQRGRMAGLDEPFELFRGFNELFIVVGLIVMFLGYGGFVVSLWLWLFDESIISILPPAEYENRHWVETRLWYGFSALVGMSITVALARYFTLRRRMIAPSIALSAIFFACASAMGLSIGGAMANGGDSFLGIGVGAATATLLLAGYHYFFRVPFALAPIALGALATALSAAAFVVTSSGSAAPESPLDYLLLSSEGPFAFITLAFGLIFLAFAMRYDLSDPHRVTRRAACAFWLHAVAAPSIMHTVAPTLFLQGTNSGKALLLLFVMVMALFAVVIDRRNFIISGMGYLVALVFALLVEGAADLAFVLLLGLGMIYLGAKWEALRGRLMRALPDFPGKSGMPPWVLSDADAGSAMSGARPSASGISAGDIREAIDARELSETQAASVAELARSRNDERSRMSGLEEPFELFRGFNEILIVVGLCVLAVGWFGLNAPAVFSSNELSTGVWALIGMCGTVALANYFTVRRRMIAPSIALAVIFTVAAWQMGHAIGDAATGDPTLAYSIEAAVLTLLLAGYYLLFRVPFAMALIALGIYATAFAFLALGGATPDSPRDLLLLSGEGPFAVLTIFLGLVFLAVALAFDMSDPHRLTRRAGAGFWMHVAAALALVNTVAATLYAQESASAQLLLVLFVMLMAVLAVVIDRRSFLIVGAGYIIALFFGLPEDPFGASTFALIAGLGFGLVVLGAQWQFARSWMMRILPDFPGKNRLPPWELMNESS